MLGKIIKKENIPEIILFAIIIFFAWRPVTNFDFWFHLKYGQYILETKSLPFKDVFSHSAFGQPAIPYEWLFQTVLAIVYQVMGTYGVQILVVAIVTSYFFVFRQTLKNIFELGIISRLGLIGGLYVLGYDYWVERPQIVGYLCFVAVVFLILQYVFKKKNLLWLTIPIFFIWTNSHASMILGIYLLFGFAVTLFVKDGWKKSKILWIYGLINFFVTLLPPLFVKVYELLWLFFQKREFISQAIDEWVPLSGLAERYYLYLALIILILGSYLWVLFRTLKIENFKLNSNWKLKIGNWLLFLPLVPLALFVISGIRQTPFSLPALFLLLVPAISLFNPLKITQSLYLLITFVLLSFVYLGTFLYNREVLAANPTYPFNVLPFIQNNLKGNMFNEYQLGGFYLYHLGPEIKTFIDGRTDMFIPQVLPEYVGLGKALREDDGKFWNYFETLVEKYKISWAVMTPESFSIWSRLSRIMATKENWVLVYFDDTAVIYVRPDGVNNLATEQFGNVSATPFAKTLYIKEERNKAREEYLKMNEISPSAVAQNALGYMLLEEQKFGEAKDRFEQALIIYPKSPAPKMNLAELAAKDRDWERAISLYRQAIKDDPTRGLAYLRLGQMIVQSGGSLSEAQEIWNKGLTATPDQEIISKLRRELER